MQMLWDRGEPNGYANQMTDEELPNTPEHTLMLVMTWGDHEVPNVATEVEARAIGAPLREPALDANRLAPGMLDPFPEHKTLGDLNGPAACGIAFFIWDTGPKRTSPPGNPISKTAWGTNPAPLGTLLRRRLQGLPPEQARDGRSSSRRQMSAKGGRCFTCLPPLGLACGYGRR